MSFYFQMSMCLFPTSGVPMGEIWNCLPYPEEDKERLKNKAHLYRLVHGGFNKKWYLLKRFVSSGHKTRSLHLPARLKNIYIAALMGFSHIHSPDGINNTLFSQGYNLEMAPSANWWAKRTFQGQGRGTEPLIVWSFLLVNWCNILSMTSCNTWL